MLRRNVCVGGGAQERPRGADKHACRRGFDALRRATRVQAVGHESDLGELTKKLVATGLTITRATVKPSRSVKGCADHTFYVVDDNGDVPPRQKVEAACEELRAVSGLSGRKAISFSCVERSWRRDWGVGSGSSTSSKALIYEETVPE